MLISLPPVMLSCAIFNGNSSTFMGTLASLVAICLIWDKKTNFVTKIIDERCTAIRNEWKQLASQVKSHTGREWDKYNSSLDKLSRLIQYCNYIRNGKAINETGLSDDDFISMIDSLESSTKMTWNAIISSYQHQHAEPIKKRIGHIKASNKSVTSAIFSLLICVWAFIMNEAVTLKPSWEAVAVSSLFGLLLCSIVFWIAMWTTFIARTTSLKKENPAMNTSLEKRRPPIYMKESIVMIWLWGNAWICYAAMIPYQETQFCMAYIIGCILPIVAMSILQYKYRHHYVTLYYSFAINHFISFWFLSSGWSLLICIGAERFNPAFVNYMIPYESLDLLMVSLEGFVLVFGLLAPVFVPYVVTYIIAWKMRPLNYRVIHEISNSKMLNDSITNIENMFAKYNK